MWSVMSAYNKLNGQYCAESNYLLHDVLKKQWNFKGFVISDWGSTYSTAPTVNAGMDLEMPGGDAMKAWFAKPQTKTDGNGAGWLTSDKILPEIAAGKITTRRGRRQREPHAAHHVRRRPVRHLAWGWRARSIPRNRNWWRAPPLPRASCY